MNTLDEITAAQVKWAESRRLRLDGHVAKTIDANLFMPLRPETRAEYEAAGGDELGASGRRPKLASLISSAALTCNVFDPWRFGDVGAIAAVVGADSGASRVRFEPKLPTGLYRSTAYPDLIFEPQGGSQAITTAVEAKFLETYRGQDSAFKDSYFADERLWEYLPGLREIAHAIANGDLRFRHLGAAQLIKHALGLARQAAGGEWRLTYIWFDYPSVEQRNHREEIDRFMSLVAGQFDFMELTWQGVFPRLAELESPMDGYIEYLADRYFRP